jgi:hypothetical protein
MSEENSMHIIDAGDKPELVYIPSGAQIIPNTYETLWEIAQTVANGEFLYSDTDIDGVPYVYYCPFPHCDGEISREERLGDEPFTHSPACIVTKARQLMKQREAQPEVKITFHTEIDATALANAVRAKIGKRSE